MTTTDTPIFPADLMAMLGVKHSNTLRAHIKAGKVPPPDVRLTAKTRYWHRATLVRAGLLVDGVERCTANEMRRSAASDLIQKLV